MFVLKRLLFVLLVVWSASTITFFIPRISDINPIRERFAELARLGGFSAGELEKIVESYSKAFGLDKPLIQQYFDYIGGVMTLDFGVSLNKFPKTVLMLIAESLPWTIGLILVTTILSFVIGNLVGALAAWPLSPRWVRGISTSFILFQGVPPVLLAILLIFFVAFKLNILPIAGAYSIGTIPDFTFEFILDVLRHQVLPGIALIFGSLGTWVLSMRGMGITIQGEDYVVFAEHKGLSSYTIFKDYYLRNAMLPQVTALALALGNVITSAIVVETIFGLPGLGFVLITAIRSNDFLVIYGIVLFITIAVALLMALVEL
ncbi:MAG TPA: peptide ABC transporter permease, partial [Deltaproteobacteria bacterium]|nr:peptide ABC transporter permease [Deltaproteobacteria bacterium]